MTKQQTVFDDLLPEVQLERDDQNITLRFHRRGGGRLDLRLSEGLLKTVHDVVSFDQQEPDAPEEEAS